MAVKTDWAAGQVLTASQTSTYLANAGLVYVAQVAVGTGVSYASVPDAFSATFDNYVINCANITGNVGSTKMYLRLEDSGGNPTSTNYALLGTSMTWGSTTVTGVTGTTWDVLSKNGNHNHFSGTFTILEPFVNDFTFMTSTHSGDGTAKFLQGKHEVAASWSRFRLTTDTGTVSGGTITVFGIRKA